MTAGVVASKVREKRLKDEHLVADIQFPYTLLIISLSQGNVDVRRLQVKANKQVRTKRQVTR